MFFLSHFTFYFKIIDDRKIKKTANNINLLNLVGIKSKL